MTYSLDFRRKVMKIKSRESMSYSEASNFFGLSKTTLLKWKKRLEPLNSRNKPSTKIDMEALSKDIELNPDSYQYERAKRLGVSTRTCLLYTSPSPRDA